MLFFLSIYLLFLPSDVAFRSLWLPCILVCLGFTLPLFLFSPLPPLFHQTMLFLGFLFSFYKLACIALSLLYSILLHSLHMSIPNELSSLHFLINCPTNFHFSFDHFISDSVSSWNSTGYSQCIHFHLRNSHFLFLCHSPFFASVC